MSIAGRPSAYIFGVGSGGAKAYDFYRRQYRILGFSDNDTKKHGSRFHGLPVIAPAELTGVSCDKIVIGSQYYLQISRQLIDAGVRPGRIVVADPEVLAGLYLLTPAMKAALATAVLVLAAAGFGLYRLVAG